MTGQVADEFRYNGEAYALVGISGEGLYTPADFGMTTRMASTACWRGYQMFYDCVDGELILDTMLANPEVPKPVNGIEPRKLENSFMFPLVYENLRLKTKFTGRILLGRDFIDEMYVHMGFQSAESFRTVIEIEIKDGEIIKETDLSQSMAERRLAGLNKPSQPPSMEEDELKGWIEERFSQDYDTD
ncbi:MAG: hypothetical protein ACFFE2_11910 [Candidatus Thorarchaeota archaeon]